MSTQGKWFGYYEGQWFGPYDEPTTTADVRASWFQFNPTSASVCMAWGQFNTSAIDVRMSWAAAWSVVPVPINPHNGGGPDASDTARSGYSERIKQDDEDDHIDRQVQHAKRIYAPAVVQPLEQSTETVSSHSGSNPELAPQVATLLQPAAPFYSTDEEEEELLLLLLQ